MKTAAKISALVLVGSLAAAVQSQATVTFTETINNIDAEVEGTPYTGAFTDAKLLSGSTVFNNTLYTITSVVVDLTMLNAAGHQTSLTIDGSTLNMTPTKSPQTLAYTLNSTQDSYIQSKDGTFNYTVLADCELENAALIVTTSVNPPTVNAPDATSTAFILGGAVSALGFLKRKLA
jgi:hypothetical protein